MDPRDDAPPSSWPQEKDACTVINMIQDRVWHYQKTRGIFPTVLTMGLTWALEFCKESREIPPPPRQFPLCFWEIPGSKLLGLEVAPAKGVHWNELRVFQPDDPIPSTKQVEYMKDLWAKKIDKSQVKGFFCGHPFFIAPIPPRIQPVNDGEDLPPCEKPSLIEVPAMKPCPIFWCTSIDVEIVQVEQEWHGKCNGCGWAAKPCPDPLTAVKDWNEHR